MEDDDEAGFHGNNRSPGSQGSSGWEVEQGNLWRDLVRLTLSGYLTGHQI